MTEPSGSAALATGAAGEPAAAAANRGSSRAHDWMVGQLPAGMLADDFFVRFVRIFQAEAETVLAHADAVPHLADPRIAPLEMVRFMARWLGTEGIDASYPEAAQRAILLTVARTLPWRGTRYGLTQLLELYSGGPVTIVDTGGVFTEGRAPQGPPEVRLEVAGTGPLPPEDFVTLVLEEVPAHVRVEIVVAGARLWPPGAPDVTQEIPRVHAAATTPVHVGAEGAHGVRSRRRDGRTPRPLEGGEG